MDYTVFYSWQYDLPKKHNRTFIHDAIAMALSRIGQDAELEDAPRIDHDTEGLPGAPEIASTILRKIESCGVFIADVSFIGKSAQYDANKPEKLLPNPNVLLELGYAAAKIGWERVVLVSNTAYGDPDRLPFDLKHRRFPITYKMNADRQHKVEEIQTKLSQDIEYALTLAIRAGHEAVADAISLLSVHCIPWMQDAGQSDYFHAPERKTVGDHLGSQQVDSALTRLIDLKLLRCDVAPGGSVYAYHWTYLGKLVLLKLGFRKARKPALQDPFTFVANTA